MLLLLDRAKLWAVGVGRGVANVEQTLQQQQQHEQRQRSRRSRFCIGRRTPLSRSRNRHRNRSWATNVTDKTNICGDGVTARGRRTAETSKTETGNSDGEN